MTKFAVAVSLSAALFACAKKQDADPPPPVVTTTAPPAAPDKNQVIVAHQRMGGDPGDEAPAALALTIAAVHPDEKPLTAAPWHAPGGDWTYMDLVSPGGAKLTAGFKDHHMKNDMQIDMYDFVVYTTDRADGAKLVDELAKTLKVKVPPKGAEKPLTPLTLNLSSMGGAAARNRDGSFSGHGTWVAGKWTSERADHAAEMFFNWSLADKTAEISEKDEDYNKDFIADLAAALRDGLGGAR